MQNNNIQVAIRVRPLLNFQDQQAWIIEGNRICSMLNNKVIAKFAADRNLGKKNIEQQLNQFSYQFDYLISQTRRSEQIYNDYVSRIIKSGLEGFNGTICAYGQTGSGKTYTMLGTPHFPGLLPCTLRELFKLINNQKEIEFKIQIAYLEIYNQNLYDLLQDSTNNNHLKIQDDPHWGIQVIGINKETVHTFQQALDILELGQTRRSYRKKENHQHSSRSHTIFRIYIESCNQSLMKSKLIRKYSFLNLVDLAGSQRLPEYEKKDYKAQTGNINKSLFLLSNVITKLAQNNNNNKLHIPYRDSKLTRLLQNSLGGNSNTLLICCVSPALMNFQQTLSTLKFGTRARKVKNLQAQNIEQGEIAKLQKIVKRQRDEYELLQTKYNEVLRELKILQQKCYEIKQIPPESKPYVKYEFNVLFEEDAFQLILKKQNNLTESIPSRKQFVNIKDKYRKILMEHYNSYCQELILSAVQNTNSLNNPKRNLILTLQKQNYIGLKFPDQSIITGKLLSNDTQKHKAMLHKLLIMNKLDTLKNMIKNNNKLDQSAVKFAEAYYKKKLQELKFVNINQPVKTRSSEANIYIWGSQKDGRLGRDGNHNIKKITAMKFKDITLGAHNTFAINQKGDVYGWGRNNYNQILSLQNLSQDQVNQSCIKIPKKIPQLTSIIKVAAGWAHCLAIDKNGQIFSWGYGEQGQLGHGNNQSFDHPLKIKGFKSIKDVFAGHSHSGFIDSKSQFYSFGCNVDCRLMQSNQGDNKQILLPNKIPLKMIKTASLGVNHTCIVTQQGKLYSGGNGTFGQLGTFINEQTIGAIIIYPSDRKFESDPSQKYCPIIEVEFFDESRRVQQVACGQAFTIVLDERGKIYTFGKGAYNRLGQNSIQNVFEPKIIQPLRQKRIKQISAGCRHGMCLTQDNELYAWGFNLYNQLGLKNEQEQQIPCEIEQLRDLTKIKIATGFFHSSCLISD